MKDKYEPNRKRPVISVTLDPVIKDSLSTYADYSEDTKSVTRIVERALRDFFTHEPVKSELEEAYRKKRRIPK